MLAVVGLDHMKVVIDDHLHKIADVRQARQQKRVEVRIVDVAEVGVDCIEHMQYVVLDVVEVEYRVFDTCQVVRIVHQLVVAHMVQLAYRLERHQRVRHFS